MNMAIVICIMVISAVAIIGFLKVHARRTPKPVETPTLILVRRRRELRATLHKIVGDESEAAQLVHAEAERLKTPRSSIEALEAAIKRVQAEQAFDRG